LLSGGLLPIVGTLITNNNVPADRRIDFENPGTWAFFALFLFSVALGAIQIALAFQKSKKLENR
jgi:hypothetical protein